MKGQVTVQLFDVLVYLVPGTVFLAAIEIGIQQSPPANGDLIGFAVHLFLAFSLGVIAHILAQISHGLINRILGANYLATEIPEFDGFDLVVARVGYVLGNPPRNLCAVFRYAEAFVMENSDTEAASIRRLMALHLFCRNSLIPIILLATAVLYRFPLSSEQVFVVVVLTVVSGVILLFGTLRYWSAAIFKVLRTFLVLHFPSQDKQ